jgi:hypothetical protein
VFALRLPGEQPLERSQLTWRVSFPLDLSHKPGTQLARRGLERRREGERRDGKGCSFQKLAACWARLGMPLGVVALRGVERLGLDRFS